MESYLSGRSGGANPVLEKESSPPFRSYIEQGEAGSAPPPAAEPLTPTDGDAETIYEEEGGPKVEVVSVDGRPVHILVHLESGRLLRLDCDY